MKNYDKILEILKDKFGWNLTDSLTTQGKKIVEDTLKAQEMIFNNSDLAIEEKKKLRVTRLLHFAIGFLLAALLFSCSKPEEDNCSVKQQEIMNHYAVQIQYVNDHPGPGGIDYSQIILLQEERNRKLANACN